MGWLFGWDTRPEIIKHLTKDQDSDAASWHTVAKYLSGNTMWAVQETTIKATGEVSRWKSVV